jgi:hypothetical protein
MAGMTPREIAMEARKREFDAKRRAANRQKGANLLGMASNPGALLRGAADIPGSVYRYLRDNEPVEIGEDVSRIASDMAGDFRKDPVKFAVDMVNPVTSVQDFADIRAQARDLRAAGDLDTASMLEQVAAMSPLAVVPVVGKVLGKGAKAAAKKAASLAVKPAKAAAEKAPLAVERAGIRGWHGSPHEFDKFDLSKIGTGEGAQAYGRGTYIAGVEPTAIEYRNALSKDLPVPIVVDGRKFHAPTSMQRMVAKYRGDVDPVLQGMQPNWDKAREAFAGMTGNEDPLERALIETDYTEALKARAEVEAMRGKAVSHGERGHLYEVDINAHPDHFLDWDAPLSAQPDIYKKVLADRNWRRRLQFRTDEGVGEMKGSDLYGMGHDQTRSLGVPGIRYLDQGSRSTGSGTSNYVVFDPDLLEIKRRYAKGGATAKAHGGRVSPLAVKRK